MKKRKTREVIRIGTDVGTKMIDLKNIEIEIERRDIEIGTEKTKGLEMREMGETSHTEIKIGIEKEREKKGEEKKKKDKGKKKTS